MLWSTLLLSITTILSPLISAQVATIYWPISSPTPDLPWVVGNKNLLAWQTGGGTGIESFDIQLHNSNRSVMIGFIPVALRVPMARLPTGKKNFGGEIEVDLSGAMPTGDGFSLIFMNTLHGQVYAKSQKFSIYATQPSNFTAPDLPVATVTATITENPNPNQQYAVTLNGIDPDATATTAIAGNAGSGTRKRMVVRLP